MLTEQLGCGQQAALGRPGQPDLAHSPDVGQLEVVQGPAARVLRSAAGGWHDRHAEAGAHQTPDGGEVVVHQGDYRLEPGLAAQGLTQLTQRRRRPGRDERLIGRLSEPDLRSPGEPVPGPDRQLQRFVHQPPPPQRRVRRPHGRELEVDLPSRPHGRDQLVYLSAQLEPDVAMFRPKAAHQVRHQPRAQRGLEGKRHSARLRVDQLVHGGQSVVQLMDQSVHVPLEGDAGVRHP